MKQGTENGRWEGDPLPTHQPGMEHLPHWRSTLGETGKAQGSGPANKTQGRSEG